MYVNCGAPSDIRCQNAGSWERYAASVVRLGFDESARAVRIENTLLLEGDILTLDSSDGAVCAGVVRTLVEPLAGLRSRLEQLNAG
jgi:hypothetical protein